MSAVVLVLVARSVGDEIFPFWLEPTPAVKMPEVVIRPWFHVPSFGENYCPGVSIAIETVGAHRLQKMRDLLAFEKASDLEED